MVHPDAKLIFTDESQIAIESAKTNFETYFPNRREDACFEWTHGFRTDETDFVDLVLCNPPFHQGTIVGDETAWQMFKDAHRALKSGGILRVIGNSSLLYQNALKKIFGNSEFVARNS